MYGFYMKKETHNCDKLKNINFIRLAIVFINYSRRINETVTEYFTLQSIRFETFRARLKQIPTLLVIVKIFCKINQWVVFILTNMTRDCF